MEKSVPDQFESRQSSIKAASMSVGIHFLLVVVLLYFVSQIPRSSEKESDRTGQIVLAYGTDSSKVEYLTSDDEPSRSVPSQAPKISKNPPPSIDLQQKLDLDLPGVSPVDGIASASSLTANTIGALNSKPYELTKEDLELIEADRKLIEARRPKGRETTISVFGAGGLTGRRFVFLMDRSKSMGEQGLGVLKQARQELRKAIDGLEPNHEFQIVVYHNSTATVSERRLLAATDDNKRLVPDFLNNLVAFGGTNHQNGLYAALAFRPDVIVMMTDGGSPNLHKGHLSALAKAAGSTQIHTIQFGTGPPVESDHFLKDLARMNSGSYRYIDVRQWLRK